MKKIFLLILFLGIFALSYSAWAITNGPLSLTTESLSQADDYNNTEITSISTNRRSTMQNQVGSAISDHERTLDEAEQNLNQALNNLNQAVSSYRSVNNRFLR